MDFVIFWLEVTEYRHDNVIPAINLGLKMLSLTAIAKGKLPRILS